MPEVPKLIYCAACGTPQYDRGKRATCSRCGCQPLPSYSYAKDSGFYPKPRLKTCAEQAAELLAQAKERRNAVPQ